MTLLNFQEELLLKEINPIKYLKYAKAKAKRNNLNYKSLKFTDDTKTKLQIKNPENNEIIKFGSSSYNDFIIYNFWAIQKNPKITVDESLQKQFAYHRRMKIINDNPYSKNNLSLKILW